MKPRLAMLTALAACACVSLGFTPPTIGDPAPRTIRFDDEGGKLVVHARHVIATGEPPRGAGTRIEIDVAGDNLQAARLTVEDPTIKRIELSPGTPSRLTLILHRDAKAADLAALMRIDNEEDGVRVTLPHTTASAPSEAAAITATAPASSIAAAVAAASAAHPTVEPRGKTTTTTIATKAVVDPAPEAESDASHAIAAAPADPRAARAARVVATPLPSDKRPVVEPSATEQSENARPLGLAERHDPAVVVESRVAELPGGESGLFAALGIIALLLVAGALIVWNRRRLGVAPPYGDAIRVLATRALGPRVRLMLLSVGDQRVLMSVSDSGAQPIGRWHQRIEEEDGRAPSFERSLAANLPEVDEEDAITPAMLAAAGITSPRLVVDRARASHAPPPIPPSVAPRTSAPSIEAAPQPPSIDIPLAPFAAAVAASPASTIPSAPTHHRIAGFADADAPSHSHSSWHSPSTIAADVTVLAEVAASPPEAVAPSGEKFAITFSSARITPPSMPVAAPTTMAISRSSISEIAGDSWPLSSRPSATPPSAALAALTAVAVSPVASPPAAALAVAPTIAMPLVATTDGAAAAALASPAVAGILKLRGQSTSPAVAPVANPDEDAAWARELLAATRMSPSGTGATHGTGAAYGNGLRSARGHGAGL